MTRSSESIRVHNELSRILKREVNRLAATRSGRERFSFIEGTKELARKWNGRLP